MPSRRRTSFFRVLRTVLLRRKRRTDAQGYPLVMVHGATAASSGVKTILVQTALGLICWPVPGSTFG